MTNGNCVAVATPGKITENCLCQLTHGAGEREHTVCAEGKASPNPYVVVNPYSVRIVRGLCLRMQETVRAPTFSTTDSSNSANRLPG